MSTDPKQSLYVKLAAVMVEIGHVPKRGRNDFHKYDYVLEADLVDVVRGKLAERGVIIIPSVVSSSREENLTTVTVEFTFIDSETGETHKAQWQGTGEDKGDKGIYKAYTGAVKYFLMKAFLIPTGDDPEDDGESARAKGATKKADTSASTAKKPPSKESLIKRIEERWKEERELGGKRPVAEESLDMSGKSVAELMELGKKVGARVRVLADKRAAEQ
jgi:hypothetical protein